MLQPTFDELARQPVEQFGVRRPLALSRSRPGDADDPLAEVVLPEPVHDDAGNERVRRVGDGPLPVRAGRCRAARTAACRTLRGTPAERSTPRFLWLPRTKTCSSMPVPSRMAGTRRGVGNLRFQVADPVDELLRLGFASTPAVRTAARVRTGSAGGGESANHASRDRHVAGAVVEQFEVRRLALPHPQVETDPAEFIAVVDGLREAAVDRVLDELEAVEDEPGLRVAAGDPDRQDTACRS